MAEKTESPRKVDRRFQVSKGQVGPWSKGQVFSLSKFKELHPIYPSTRPNPSQAPEDVYHDGLLNRLLGLNVIVETANDAQVSDIDPGHPLSHPQEVFEDPGEKRMVSRIAEAITQANAQAPAKK